MTLDAGGLFSSLHLLILWNSGEKRFHANNICDGGLNEMCNKQQTKAHPHTDNQLGCDLIFALSFRVLITCHIFPRTETASDVEYRILALSVKWFVHSSNDAFFPYIHAASRPTSFCPKPFPFHFHSIFALSGLIQPKSDPAWTTKTHILVPSHAHNTAHHTEQHCTYKYKSDTGIMCLSHSIALAANHRVVFMLFVFRFWTDFLFMGMARHRRWRWQCDTKKHYQTKSNRLGQRMMRLRIAQQKLNRMFHFVKSRCANVSTCRKTG